VGFNNFSKFWIKLPPIAEENNPSKVFPFSSLEELQKGLDTWLKDF